MYRMNILDNMKSLLFCINTFGFIRTIDVIYSENQPGSEPGKFGPDPGRWGLQGTSDTKSIETRKKALKLI